MSTCSDKIERHYILEDLENKLKRKSNCRSLKIFRTEDDKRTRREVANNNERRRMQSINAGFENLRKLLPFCSDREKISKAAILQSTAKYITDLRAKINSLENELTKSSNSEKISVKDKALQVYSVFSNEEVTDIGETTYSYCKNESNTNPRINEDMQFPTLNICSNVNSGSTSDLGSSLSSSVTDNLSSALVNLNSEDEVMSPMDSFSNINESNGFSQSNNLEQLLAAVEQVERLEAMQTISSKGDLNPYKTHKSQVALNVSPYSKSSSSSELDSNNFIVMKPMISPFAEKIIQDAVNLQIPCDKLTASIISSNSFILPLNCPTYITTSMTKRNKRNNSE